MELGFPALEQVVTALVTDEESRFRDAVTAIAEDVSDVAIASSVGPYLVIPASGAPTLTLLDSQAGSTVVVERASCTVTLPRLTSTTNSIDFTFYVTAASLTNLAIIAPLSPVGATEGLYSGRLAHVDTDTSNALNTYAPNGSSHRTLTLNGSTQGGMNGSWVTLRGVLIGSSTPRWLVSGIVYGTGAPATPFS